MRVLLISKYDNFGGSGIAAHRFFKALVNNLKEYSTDIVTEESINSNLIGIIPYVKWRFWTIINYRLLALYRRFFSDNEYRTVSFYKTGLGKAFASLSYDIYVIHWFGGSFFTVQDLDILSKKKRVIWILHDFWPFIGVFHYPNFYHGNRFRTCLNNDALMLKFIANQPNVRIFCVSQWHRQMLLQLTKMQLDLEVLHNCIDTQLFFPDNRYNGTLESLRIPKSKKIVSFGSFKSFDDPRKGADLLVDVLKNFNDLDEIHLLIFGGKTNIFDSLGITKTILGVIEDTDLLRQIYSMSDVFLVPSRLETFGQTALEALACGTPVVSFNNGGVLDVIPHMEFGYIADKESIPDFINGINFCLNLKNEAFKRDAHKFVFDNFSGIMLSTRFKELLLDV